jgi:hypothetical protein
MSLQGSVCIFKLISGDELIATFTSENETSVVLKDPLIVEEGMNADGVGHILLTSYVPFARETQILTFNKFHVIQILPINEEAERFYLNSLSYNQKHVANNQEERLKAANETMEEFMSSMITDEPKSSKRPTHKPSKSIH